jgi:Tol biopolymer transport system component
MHEEMDVDAPKEVRGLTSSPDGKKIAFAPAIRSNGKSDTNLWIMDTTTNKITKIQIPGTCYDPTWSPRDDRILIKNTTHRGFNVCTINKDGTEFNVWTNSLTAMNQKGQWSTDGSKIGFVKKAYIPGVSELWIADLAKNTSSRVVKGSSCCLLAERIYTTWFLSKEDKLVYWDCEVDNEATEGLYATSIDSPAEVESFAPLKLNYGNIYMYPSPDGDKLAYGGYCVGLFIYDFSTQKVKEYDDLCEMNSHLWTPYGKNILYDLCKDKNIHMLNLETGESTILAEGSFWGKAFGPGGKSIYYLKWDEKAEQHSIWRINLDGTNNIKIFPVEGIEYTTVHPTPVLKWAERD